MLSDTEMDEIGALHLSYILQFHHAPDILLTRVPHAKAGAPAQQLSSYKESHCRGIIYLPNPLLGSAGHKVLELAELMRDYYSKCILNYSHETSKALTMSPDIVKRASWARAGLSVDVCDSRRRLIATTRPSDQAEQENLLESEFDRARSRIQGNTLQNAGPKSNDLWRAAFKMLSMGREIRPQIRNEPPSRSLAPRIKASVIKSLKIPGYAPNKTKPMTPLICERDPNQPISPWTTQLHKKRGSLHSTPVEIQSIPLTSKLPVLLVRLPTATADYRTKLPCGLPEHVWRRIIGLAAGAEGIMYVSSDLSSFQAHGELRARLEDYLLLGRVRDSLKRVKQAMLIEI